MPELPEVERATTQLRAAAVGQRLRALVLLHDALRRKAGDLDRVVAGRDVEAVERRGKYQLLRLRLPDDTSRRGRARAAEAKGDPLVTLQVHFRMAGDWQVDAVGDEVPRHARALFEFENGTRVVLIDRRALATLHLLPGGSDPEGLGPEASDPTLTAAILQERLAGKRGPIKPALLDQRVLAGIGNIYASEALWHARIHPATPTARIGATRMARLLEGIRTALEAGKAGATRYTDAEVESLAVYGRAGEPCRRCDGTVRKSNQAGRSSYFCAGCQRR